MVLSPEEKLGWEELVVDSGLAWLLSVCWLLFVDNTVEMLLAFEMLEFLDGHFVHGKVEVYRGTSIAEFAVETVA